MVDNVLVINSTDDGLRAVILFGLTIACAYTDAFKRKIYNKITYPLILVGLVLSFVKPPPDFKGSVIGMIAAFFFFFWLHKLGGMGAGDVKLMAAIGALKGLSFVVYATFYTFCFGGLVAVVLLAWHGRLIPVCKWLVVMMISLIFPRVPRPSLEKSKFTTIPFAPVIFCGTVFTIYLESLHGSFSLW